ncbi:MAG: serine/threonine-protein phosphatase, partial [Bacteroidaceae bacterium]|nr:serine/threonine-protein phosphatase [Bacteroidaceae bacterium]
MKYILKAYNIWELGQRANQEDSIYPEYGKATDSDRLFILCDGMGGHSSGEVASQTVCSSMSSSVLNNCPDSEGSFSDEDFKIALDDAFNALDAKDNGAVKKMGTTLTFLKLHSDGCTIAHIGDSRVYHIRPGKEAADTEILFQTVDHSLVNDLIKIGELTPEEAKFSKQKNVITRA